MQITYSVSANVALTVAQTVTNIAGTPELKKRNENHYDKIAITMANYSI